MIEIKHNRLRFQFPEVHKGCKMDMEFQRTLRIPDDGKNYPLPPGLGPFPLALVDDHSERVPAPWLAYGGVLLPMYAAEALWLNFDGPEVPGHGVPWPFAIKVAAGKVNAVDGETWSESLGQKQDYLVTPEQPWLDGFFAGEGLIRQFVAVHMGGGYTVEEQVTGKAEHGGLQFMVYPMKREEFMRRFPKLPPRSARTQYMVDGACPSPMVSVCCESPGMGLGAGGRMEQEIYDDPYGQDVWDLSKGGRCFVHLSNALVWRAITGSEAPTVPPTAKEYERSGLPWFEWYGADQGVLAGEDWLANVKSVATVGAEKGEHVLPENESVTVHGVVKLGTPVGSEQVREGVF